MGKKNTLSGNQEKIDANKDGQITKQDFEMLRAKGPNMQGSWIRKYTK